jgi:hypothetical protein
MMAAVWGMAGNVWRGVAVEKGKIVAGSVGEEWKGEEKVGSRVGVSERSSRTAMFADEALWKPTNR